MPWEMGPRHELVHAVETGKVSPCRALDLGCGSGSNAIFLAQQGLLPSSPADEILPPEREREERRVLSEAEYKRLMGAVQHEVRDGAILELLLQIAAALR